MADQQPQINGMRFHQVLADYHDIFRGPHGCILWLNKLLNSPEVRLSFTVTICLMLILNEIRFALRLFSSFYGLLGLCWAFEFVLNCTKLFIRVFWIFVEMGKPLVLSFACKRPLSNLWWSLEKAGAVLKRLLVFIGRCLTSAMRCVSPAEFSVLRLCKVSLFLLVCAFLLWVVKLFR